MISKKVLFVTLIAIIVCGVITSPASGQTFKNILDKIENLEREIKKLEKLNALELRLNNLESHQKQELNKMQLLVSNINPEEKANILRILMSLPNNTMYLEFCVEVSLSLALPQISGAGCWTKCPMPHASLTGCLQRDTWIENHVKKTADWLM